MRRSDVRTTIPFALFAGLLALSGSPAYAQEATAVAQSEKSQNAAPATSAPSEGSPAAPASEQPSISSSVPALRDFKQALLDRGFNLQLNYTGEVFGNPTGGVRQSGIYENLLELAIDGDLQRIAGLTGASFHVNSYQVSGSGLSTCCVFNQLTISSIEARASTWLFEAWFEQKLFADMVSIRIGQLAADSEFFISDLDSFYLNATFGWPNILAADLPSSGPNYPLATPGVRLKITPNDQTTLLAAIFNGDPSGAGFTGLQEVLDPSGVNFRLRDPPLLIGEVQYKYNQDKNSAGLAGTAKLGAWYHFGKFNDQYYSTNGVSLANPSSSGVPLTHAGDYGVYGIINQMLWRLPGDDPRKGVGVFAFVSAAPSDRNAADFYVHGAINFMGLWDKRPDDAFGVAAAYSPVSPAVSALDAQSAYFARAALPIRNYEMALEVSYQAPILPGWLIQPDFQYIFHPRYGAIDPINPALGRIRDAAVFGLHTAIKF